MIETYWLRSLTNRNYGRIIRFKINSSLAMSNEVLFNQGDENHAKATRKQRQGMMEKKVTKKGR